MGKCQVGGQAILDGIMMNGEKGIATAVRKEDGSINLRLERRFKNSEKSFKSFPFFRGIFNLYEAAISGVSGFDVIDVINEEFLSEKQTRMLEKVFRSKIDNILKIFILFLAGLIAASVFMIIPTLIMFLVKDFFINKIYLGIIESFFCIAILIVYLYLIGRNKEVNKLFRYHGAEHKSISCYEKGNDLTIDNVKKEKRLHKRCGTNLVLITFVLSNILFVFITWEHLFLRILIKILIVPFAASISYEIISYISKHDNVISKTISFPGLSLQLLTTKEPDQKQIEVAILALKKSEGLRIDKTVRELLNEANLILKREEIESYILDSQLLLSHVLDKSKLWIITNSFERVSEEKEKEFLKLIEKRKSKYPINYILEEAEFMGIDFIVKEGVLIPRPDTEILVEEVLKNIEENEGLNICDLCCGSGAIGLSLASLRKNIKVDLLDIDKTPEFVTRLNIKNLKLEDRATFIHSDLLESVNGKKYDIIVSNPPYIKEEVIETLMEDVKNYEPHLALSGGDDGMIFYRKIIKNSITHLMGKGILAFEIGHDQGAEVKTLMEEAGFVNLAIIKDLAGFDRVVIGKIIIE